MESAANGIWAVADGMGGHYAGAVASRAVVAALATVSPSSRPSTFVSRIEECLSTVNRELYDRSVNGSGGICGTTVAVLAVFDAYVVCIWAGDSRIYCRSGQSLELITQDHTKAREFIDAGKSHPSHDVPASNIITRAVGGAVELVLDLEIREIHDGDRFLLCTDGLYRELSEADMASHLNKEPRAACDAMLEQSLRGPCNDNATALMVAFRGR